jgi:ADP-ribose pyrophosphatase
VNDASRPLADVPESWPVVGSEDLHRDDWVVALRSDRVVAPGDPDGEPFRRLVMEHPGAAVVLAVDGPVGEERVLLVRQYRHAAQRRFVELPAGLCDAHGEDPLAVAKRELREEAQYAASEWTHLTSAYSSPGISAELIHYYLARGLTPADRGDFAMVHEEADLEVFWAPFTDLVDAVLAGRVADAPLVVAVLAAQAAGLVGKDPSGT